MTHWYLKTDNVCETVSQKNILKSIAMYQHFLTPVAGGFRYFQACCFPLLPVFMLSLANWLLAPGSCLFFWSHINLLT